ncbi:MAG TPA: cytochrome b/b6 domain-containing protein [Fimbriimonas sp.]
MRRQVFQPFERFWHWTQAALVLFLALTGFEVHGSLSFFGFDQAVRYHNLASWGFIALILVAMFWHLATGEWAHYVPTTKNVGEQARYYLIGIFRNEPHPGHAELSKLNPLQRIVYAGLKVLVIPLMVTTGIFYLSFHFVRGGQVGQLHLRDLSTIAALHTLGAFALMSFLIAHLYLMTTGRTATSNLKAMLTGYEEDVSDAR